MQSRGEELVRGLKLCLQAAMKKFHEVYYNISKCYWCFKYNTTSNRIGTCIQIPIQKAVVLIFDASTAPMYSRHCNNWGHILLFR